MVEPGLVDSSWQCTSTHCFVLQQFLATLNLAVVSHPPCSPDLALCYFLLLWEWNCSYKHTVSKMSLKVRNSHWLSYMQFRKLSWAVLPAMAETENPLHTLTRGIFTKKRQLSVTKVSTYSVSSSVSELLDEPFNI